MSPRTLMRWRKKGKGPPFIKVGQRGILYKAIDIESYENKNNIKPE